MKALLRKYKYLVIVVLFLLVVYFIVPSINYTNCRSSQRFHKIIFDGVVVKKYLDRSEHSMPTIEILDLNDSLTEISFFGEHTGIYDRINISDSLRKIRGSNEILIKTRGEYLQFGVVDFKCDSAKLENEKYLFWVYDLFGTVPPDNTLEEK